MKAVASWIQSFPPKSLKGNSKRKTNKDPSGPRKRSGYLKGTSDVVSKRGYYRSGGREKS
jgi:hypothetical protein